MRNSNAMRDRVIVVVAITGALVVGAVLFSLVVKPRPTGSSDSGGLFEKPEHRQKFDAYVEQLRHAKTNSEQRDCISAIGDLAGEHPDLVKDARKVARHATESEDQFVRVAGEDVLAYLNRKYHWDEFD